MAIQPILEVKVLGRIYYFTRILATDAIPECPAIYMFCAMAESGDLLPVYIGKSENLKHRFYNHHKSDCIIKNHGNYFYYLNVSISELEPLEKALIECYCPPCNEQLVVHQPQTSTPR